MQTNFGTLDWIIVCLYGVGSIGIGLICRKYIRNMSDYLVAGRSVRLWLGVATLTGTELGLVTIMYNAEMGFRNGFAALHIGIVVALCSLFIGLTGFIVSRLRQEGVMTIPEYYGRRYGKDVRVLGGIMLALSGILNMGLFLKMGAIFVQHVLGLEPDGDKLKLVMSVMLVLVLLYTALGGLVSVIFTDFVQFLVVGGGLIVATGYCLFSEQLGWHRMVEAVVQNPAFEGAKPTRGFDPLAVGDFGWIYIVWMVAVNLSACALWFPGTTRALSSKDHGTAKRLFAWSALSYFARVAFPVMWGVAAFVLVSNTPELKAQFFPDVGEPVLGSKDAMPILFARVIPSGLLGLLAAGMMAAFMSTHDSYLLAWSAVITQDIVAPLRKRPMSTRGRIWLTRALIIAIGLFLLLWGLWFEIEDSVWNYMAGTGTIYLAGALSCVGAGLYWKRASRMGARAALVAGILGVGTMIPWERLGYPGVDVRLIAVLTFALAIVGMVACSLIFPDRPAAEPEEAPSE